MNIPEIAQVGSIVIITYLLGMGLKASRINDEYIPVLLGIIGGILGVAGMSVMADFPANNILDAIAVGIVSGLASTGVHQVFKQLGGAHGTNKETDSASE